MSTYIHMVLTLLSCDARAGPQQSGADAVAALQTCSTSNSCMDRCLAARDAFGYSLLWSTGFRVGIAREVCLSQFWLPVTDQQCCQPVLPSIVPEFSLPMDSAVELVPQCLKTSLKVNQASVRLIVLEQQLLDPLCWLHVLMRENDAFGSPISQHLVRPLNRQGKRFQEKPMNSSSLMACMAAVVSRLGLYEGESTHSFRRGVAQQMHSRGICDSLNLKQLLIVTPRVLRDLLSPCWKAPR